MSPTPSAVEIAAAVRAGARRAVDVVAACLDRIAAAQPRLNAFTLVTAEAAHTAAAAVDRKVAAGEDPGPLAGVPVAVKDLIDQAGLPNTLGASFPPAMPETDAPAVARLAAAGAVMVGRTGLHEFAFGFSSENPWFGPVRNPWDPATSPGGSSGGSAAAVAAGLVPVALGTDTGGSVRVPAALCGVVGLKVTPGRVSLRGVFPLVPSIDTVGPITAGVADAALTYGVLAGHDPLDPWSLPRPVEAPPDPPPLATLRIGVPHPWVDRTLDATVSAGWASFRRSLEATGATIVDLELPELTFPGLIGDSISAEVANVHRSRFAANPDGYGPETRTRVAAALVAADMGRYLDALAWRRRIRETAVNALETCDLLATPTVAAQRKVIGIDTIDLGGEPVGYRTPLSCFSALVNHAALPALSLPLRRPGSPPPSIQLIAAPWAEATLLAAGAALEAAGMVGVTSPPG